MIEWLQMHDHLMIEWLQVWSPNDRGTSWLCSVCNTQLANWFLWFIRDCEDNKKFDYQDDVVQDLGAAVTLLIVHIDHCD